MVRSAALAPDSSARSAYDDVSGSSRGRAERVDPGLDVVAGPQRADQLGHVDAGAAVHLGRVLLGEHVDAHGRP